MTPIPQLAGARMSFGQQIDLGLEGFGVSNHRSCTDEPRLPLVFRYLKNVSGNEEDSLDLKLYVVKNGVTPLITTTFQKRFLSHTNSAQMDFQRAFLRLPE
jgi:hypothetical protein